MRPSPARAIARASPETDQRGIVSLPFVVDETPLDAAHDNVVDRGVGWTRNEDSGLHSAELQQRKLDNGETTPYYRVVDRAVAVLLALDRTAILGCQSFENNADSMVMPRVGARAGWPSCSQTQAAMSFRKESSEKVAWRNTMHIVGKGWSKGALSWFFKVEDRYETYMDEDLSRFINPLIGDGVADVFAICYVLQELDI